jgi:fatty acid desaturase
MPSNLRRGSEYTLPLEKYKVLAERVAKAGCFARTPFQFLAISLTTGLGLAISFGILLISDSLLVQIPNALLAAFFTVQLGLIGHDLSHGGVFKKDYRNRLLAILVWGLGCGLSEGRWYAKHNAHHRAPNHIGHDPDVDIPFVFDHEQAESRSAFAQKYLFPYQPALFWVGLWFVYPYNILNSMKFLFRPFTLLSLIEIFLMIVHFTVAFSVTFMYLPDMVAAIFNIVVLLAIGVYMGLIFAPNHKGEDMLPEDATPNWVHQITLTRNITPSPLTSYILGGLNYQIEHHLFPNMSRFQYKKARTLVRKFCQAENIPYHETTWLKSMRQIHESLKEEAIAWQR